jgi:16S rRNA (adenine1518-N6/adenine1519-N6)-dimethyltransferase
VSLTKSQTTSLLDGAAIKPKRKFGQNFVVDPNTVERIVRLAGISKGDHVLEIGAGLGALTGALLDHGAKVTTIEVDPDLVGVLRQRPELADARICEIDALTMEFDDVVPAEEGPWTVVANLPYNVATPVILRCLEEAPQITRFLVMVQLEVGERLAATVGDDAYGAVSVRVAYHGAAQVVGKVARSVFLPEPNVDSALVAVERSARAAVDPSQASEAEIFALVRQSFGQRRKMLRRSLANVVPDEAFARAGVAPTARPEELSVVEFGRLAAAIR